MPLSQTILSGLKCEVQNFRVSWHQNDLKIILRAAICWNHHGIKKTFVFAFWRPWRGYWLVKCKGLVIILCFVVDSLINKNQQILTCWFFRIFYLLQSSEKQLDMHKASNELACVLPLLYSRNHFQLYFLVDPLHAEKAYKNWFETTKHGAMTKITSWSQLSKLHNTINNHGHASFVQNEKIVSTTRSSR